MICIFVTSDQVLVDRMIRCQTKKLIYHPDYIGSKWCLILIIISDEFCANLQLLKIPGKTLGMNAQNGVHKNRVCLVRLPGTFTLTKLVIFLYGALCNKKVTCGKSMLFFSLPSSSLNDLIFTGNKEKLLSPNLF